MKDFLKFGLPLLVIVGIFFAIGYKPVKCRCNTCTDKSCTVCTCSKESKNCCGDRYCPNCP